MRQFTRFLDVLAGLEALGVTLHNSPLRRQRGCVKLSLYPSGYGPSRHRPVRPLSRARDWRSLDGSGLRR